MPDVPADDAGDPDRVRRRGHSRPGSGAVRIPILLRDRSRAIPGDLAQRVEIETRDQDGELATDAQVRGDLRGDQRGAAAGGGSRGEPRSSRSPPCSIPTSRPPDGGSRPSIRTRRSACSPGCPTTAASSRPGSGIHAVIDAGLDPPFGRLVPGRGLRGVQIVSPSHREAAVGIRRLGPGPEGRAPAGPARGRGVGQSHHRR